MPTKFRFFFQTYTVVFCVMFLVTDVYAFEPIATIGQPTPIQHEFLTNELIVRVVPTHIQIVETNTGTVVDEFGELTYYDDVVFSPNSSHLAIQKHDEMLKQYSIEIWDVNTRDMISQWYIQEDFDLAAFSPTEPLFVALIDNKVYLWNWQTGESIDTIIGDRRVPYPCYTYTNLRGTGINSICASPPREKKMVFTPDGKYLFVASQRPDIEVWDIEKRELVDHIEGHTGNWIDGLAISSDGTYLASFESRIGTIYIWDVASKQLLWTTKNGIGQITDMAFSPNNQHLYVTTTTTSLWRSGLNPWKGWDDKIRVWNIKSGEQIDTIETKFRGLNEIKLSSNGNTALLQYVDAVILWDIDQKHPMRESTQFMGHWYLHRSALSPDGNTVVSLSRYFLKTWDVSTQQVGLLISADEYRFDGLAISPDSKKVAVGKDPWIDIIDIQTGKVDTQLHPKFVRNPEEIVYSQTGRWLAVSDGWNHLSILDINKPDNFQNLAQDGIPAGIEGFDEFAFSENDTYFVVSGPAGQNQNRQSWIQLWKRINDKFVFQYAWQTPEGTRYFSSTPIFTTKKDGTTLLATAFYEEIHIWRILPDRAQHLSRLDTNGISPVRFTQDGRYLFTNSGLIDWRTNRTIKNRSFPSGYTDLSKDGTILLSYNDSGQYDIFEITDILSLLPYSVEPKDKLIVTLGLIKRNQLLQNFPNPFNPETWIPFRLANESDVTIDIYTPSGRLVRTLSMGKIVAGDYTSQSKAVYWDGRNNNGESISSGVYLYTINAGDFSATRKMLIRK